MVSPQRFFLSLLSFFCLSSFFSFLIIHLARRGSVTRKTASEIDNYEWWNCSTKAHCSSSRGRRRSWKGVWAPRNGRHRYGRDEHDGHGEIGLLEESWKELRPYTLYLVFYRKYQGHDHYDRDQSCFISRKQNENHQFRLQ